MNILIDNGFKDDIQFGKVICSQVIVIGESLGLHAEGTSGFIYVLVFNRDRKVFSGAILAACMLTVGEIDDLFIKKTDDDDGLREKTKAQS